MDASAAAQWMLEQIECDGCIYQDDVVDHLAKAKAENLLRENADGNLVVGKPVLDALQRTGSYRLPLLPVLHAGRRRCRLTEAHA